MPEDYYEDAGESANNPEGAGMGEDSKDDHADDSALVPKSILPKDAKPGDVCSFKIVHLYDEEAEIQYVKKDDEEKAEGEDMANPVDKMAREMGEE